MFTVERFRGPFSWRGEGNGGGAVGSFRVTPGSVVERAMRPACESTHAHVTPAACCALLLCVAAVRCCCALLLCVASVRCFCALRMFRRAPRGISSSRRFAFLPQTWSQTSGLKLRAGARRGRTSPSARGPRRRPPARPGSSGPQEHCPTLGQPLARSPSGSGLPGAKDCAEASTGKLPHITPMHANAH